MIFMLCIEMRHDRKEMIEPASKGRITDDGKHRVETEDPVDGTIYYRNMETGSLEFIARNGEWVEA